MREKREEVALVWLVMRHSCPHLSVSGVAFGSRVPVASIEQWFFNGRPRELECSCNRSNTVNRKSSAYQYKILRRLTIFVGTDGQQLQGYVTEGNHGEGKGRSHAGSGAGLRLSARHGWWEGQTGALSSQNLVARVFLACAHAWTHLCLMSLSVWSLV